MLHILIFFSVVLFQKVVYLFITVIFFLFFTFLFLAGWVGWIAVGGWAVVSYKVYACGSDS